MMHKKRLLWSFLATCAVIGLQCEFKQLDAPNWDVDLKVPLINKTYTMQELIDDEKSLSIDDQDRIVYTYEDSIDRFEMAEFLEVEPGKQKTLIDYQANLEPEHTKSDTSFLEIVDVSIIVENAMIRSGTVYVTLDNKTDYSVELEIVLPEFRKSGNPLSRTKYLNPGDHQTETFDLSDVSFSPGHSADGMTVTYVTHSRVQWGNQSVLKFIDMEIDFSEILLAEVTGWMTGKSIAIDPVESEVDLPSQLEGIQLGAVSMVVDLYNGLDMPASLDLQIQGSNEKGEEKTLSLQRTLQSRMNHIRIEGMEQIVNIFPEEIRITGSVILGSGYGGPTFTVREGDYFEGNVQLEVPLVFSVPQRTFNPMMVDTLEMDEEEQDNLKTNVKEAHLIAEVKNRLPFGFSLQILFSNTIGDSVLYEPGKAAVTKTLEITACRTRQAGPYLEAYNPPAESELDLGINQADLRVLSKSPLYMGMKFIFPATGGLVKIDPSDYVTLYGRIEGTFNTTVPEDEEGGES
jgi:hypothetical protein